MRYLKSESMTVLVTSFALTACGGSGEDLSVTESSIVQQISVKSLTTGAAIPGSTAKLEREADLGQVKVEVETTLDPNQTVDLLFIVFNNPDACVFGNPVTGATCGPRDLFIPETEAGIFFISTLTADAEGELEFTIVRSVGDTSGCLGDPFPCNPLTNVDGAEIHASLFAPNGGPGVQAAQFLAP
jgi:hypothetical protein